MTISKIFITCVNYSDFLAHTLRSWMPHAKGVYVISTHEDTATESLVNREGVHLLRTNEWFSGGSPGINKGAAMNHTIPQVTAPSEIIALVDADCFLSGRIPDFAFREDTIYGCERVACRTPEEFAAKRTLPSEHQIFMRPAPSSDRPHLIRGYFQLFKYHPDLRFGATKHKSFSGCDLYFAAQFARQEMLSEKDLCVFHLGQHARNWKGRVTAPWKE